MHLLLEFNSAPSRDGSIDAITQKLDDKVNSPLHFGTIAPKNAKSSTPIAFDLEYSPNI
jgi:hypothetical protein